MTDNEIDTEYEPVPEEDVAPASAMQTVHARLNHMQACADELDDGNSHAILARIRALLAGLPHHYHDEGSAQRQAAEALAAHTAAIEAAPRAGAAPVFTPSTEEEIANDPSTKAAEATDGGEDTSGEAAPVRHANDEEFSDDAA